MRKSRPLRAGFGQAIRHGAPIVPAALVGAEEQMPQLTRLTGVRAFGLPYLPIPATPFPLPVRYHIAYGAPISVHLEQRTQLAGVLCVHLGRSVRSLELVEHLAHGRGKVALHGQVR